MAAGLNSLEVYQVGMSSRQNNVHAVGQLSQCLILPDLLTMFTVPVLDVTVLIAVGGNSLNMDDFAANSGNNNVLNVGQLGQSLVSPNLLTFVADPVLDLAVIVAAGLDGFEVDNFAAGCGQNHVLDVGQLSQSLILPDALTVIADPVLDLAFVVATGSDCIEVNQVLVTARNLKDSGDSQSCLGSLPVFILGANIQHNVVTSRNLHGVGVGIT